MATNPAAMNEPEGAAVGEACPSEAKPSFDLPPVRVSVAPAGAAGNVWAQIPAPLVIPRGIAASCACPVDVLPATLATVESFARGPVFRSSDAPAEADPRAALSIGNRPTGAPPSVAAARAGLAALGLGDHRVPWDLFPPGTLAHHGPCGDRGPEENFVSWTNWAGTLFLDAVDDLFRNRPESVDQLVATIRCAEFHGERVRVTGSSWSFSDVAIPGGAKPTVDPASRGKLWIPNPGNGGHGLEMTAFNHLLGATFPTIIDWLSGLLGGKPPASYGRVIPGALKTVLSPPGEGGMGGGKPGRRGRTGLLHVEAGITIRELYTYLDFEGDGGRQDNRWALPTQGGSGGQRLAGALSTGTHGGDFHEIAMTDMVRAIHLVGPGGIQYWIEPRSARLTDDQKLVKALPGVRLIAEDDTFRAALVSMGSLGVIVAVVIEVVPQFGLHEDRFDSDWAQVRATLPRWLADPDTHFLGITVNPYKLGGRPNQCWVTRRRKLDVVPKHDTFAKQNQGGSGFDIASILGFFEGRPMTPDQGAALANLIVSAASPLVEGILAPLLGGFGLPYPPGLLSLFLAALFPRLAQTAQDLRDGKATVEQVLSTEVLDRVPQLIPQLISSVIGTIGQAPHSVDGVGYQVMDTYPYKARLAVEGELAGALKIYSLEMAFELNRGLAFMEDLLERRIALLRDPGGLMMAGIFAIRSAPPSKALLSMSRFSPTMFIEAYSLKHFKNSQEILRRLEKAALEAAGIVHWGQHQDQLNASDVSRFYGPDRTTWRSVRTALIRNWLALDPRSSSPYPVDGCVFDNDFTVRCGLSPALK